MDKRARSPNYPAMSLPDAIQRIHMLYKVQHTHAAPRDVLVKGIGYNSLNGASATAISAIGKYGLLDRVGDGLKLSERAMSIIAPHSPAEKSQAIRDAAREPKLFAELLDKFPPPLPGDEVLRNYLIRSGFLPAAVTAAVLAYRETMDLVDREAGGYDSGTPVSESAPVGSPMLPSPAAKPTEPLANFVSSNREGTRDLGRWQFEDGGWVQILASQDVSTREALDMAEMLIQIRRNQLLSRNAAPAEAASASENDET